jgi:hypothetical protein
MTDQKNEDKNRHAGAQCPRAHVGSQRGQEAMVLLYPLTQKSAIKEGKDRHPVLFGNP